MDGKEWLDVYDFLTAPHPKKRLATARFAATIYTLTGTGRSWTAQPEGLMRVQLMGLKVNYGAGWTVAPGWLSYDSSPSIWLERLPVVGRLISVNGERFPNSVKYGNILNGLPIPDESASAVYASHVLEHLALADLSVALKNTLKIMQPGGIFRLIVPDLYWRAEQYLESFRQADAMAAHNFMKGAYLGLESRPRSIPQRLRALLGNSSHLWMWDENSMTEALNSAGFVDIRRCKMGDAADPAFQDVESYNRFVDSSGLPEVALEARKPV